MKKKILYFDMDNVLVDFASGIACLSEETRQEYEGRLDDVPGIFGLMKPMPGAIEAVRLLSRHFDCYILSTAPWKNLSAWSDKAIWVQKYFGDDKDGVFYKRLIISHRKDLNRGDFLIDDRTKNGAGEFDGELIQFGSKQFPDWEAVLKYFRNRLAITNSLLGGAIGDSMGAPIEFMSIDHIRQLYGQQGVTDYIEHPDNYGEFTDDTQMTLFTAECLLQVCKRQSVRNITDISAEGYNAYQNWLITQTESFDDHSCNSWLLTRKELFKRRYPGNTCISALLNCKFYTITSPPKNDSKGCGAIMRMAPVGLLFNSEQSFDIGCALGVLTHGHPSGYLSAGFFAAIISFLIGGEGLEKAIEKTIPLLTKYDRHKETLAIVNRAVDMAKTTECTPENIERLGGGWVGEEALAIALYCALCFPDNFEKAVLASVNHSGDSDSTGSITGNIMGILAMDTIPQHWIDKLLYNGVVVQIAKDLGGV
jgi:ADP-ribosylglycohydrolase/5'(3')-deoxyribonucleotidase